MASPFLTPEEREWRKTEATKHSIVEGAKAASVMGALAVVGHQLLQRFTPAYQRVNFRLKTFLWTASVIAAYSVSAERGHLELMREFYALDAQRVAAADASHVQSRRQPQSLT